MNHEVPVNTIVEQTKNPKAIKDVCISGQSSVMVNTVVEASKETTMKHIKAAADTSKHHQEFLEIINNTKQYLTNSKIGELKQYKTQENIITLTSESSPNYKYELVNGEVK